MTIKEAENQYKLEVANSIKQHKKQAQKMLAVWKSISGVLFVLGSVLIVVGLNASDLFVGIFAPAFGIVCLGGALAGLFIALSYSISQKKGPKNFLPQIKNLYLNYLKCEDMSQDDKQYYVQKLENIRNMELISAVHGASAAATAAASTAVMFSILNK